MRNKNILVVISVILLLIVLPLISYYFLSEGESLRTQRRVPSFSFITHTEDSLHAEDLYGNVYLANFVFSRCAYICDSLNAAFAAIQYTFKGREDLKLLTFTIDPDYDSLPVLKSMADRYNAIEGKWHFITGERQQIHDLIFGGFFGKIKFGQGTPETMVADPKIVLVNRQGYIVGYYNAETEEQRLNLINAVNDQLSN